MLPIWNLLRESSECKLLQDFFTCGQYSEKKLSWKYCNYYHPPYIKKYAHLVQNFCSLSHQSPTLMTLSSIYFYIISIFLRGSGATHSYTVHLIVSLSKIDCTIYQRGEPTAASEMFLKLVSLVIKIHNVNKNECNSKF